MPTPEGLATCDTCGLPYQLGRKAAHDLKASHRAAVLGPGRTRTRQVTVTTTTTPTESFGQRMARLRKEKAAQAEQQRAPANPDADVAQGERNAAKAEKPTRAEKAAQRVDAKRASGKRPEPTER